MTSLFSSTLLILVAFLSCVAAEKQFPDDVLYRVEADRCTAIIVAPKASVGGPMTTHTNDCSDCDFRVSKVPARDWPAGSMRPLYLLRSTYPSQIGSDRGETWKPENLEGTPEQLQTWTTDGTFTQVTGYIPQVPHTYALFEGQYGIMNEHQVAIGESTCAAKLWAAPITAGGKARIEVKAMSQIALERSTTARQAIQIMGDLATSLGFYAADWSGGDISLGEGGEALTVIDKTEAWVFHVLADDTGASAVWVAQRLEDDHVTAVANQFIIREVDPKSDRFMFSSNLWEVAERQGFWKKSDGPLDFLKTYAPMRSHSPYATRRVWRVFNIVAPHTKISPYTDSYASDYPFSVKVEKPLTPQDVMQMQRDHYEGTEFDMTKGVAAGPYGDPNRFDMAPVDNMTFEQVLQGSYQRSISLFRTSYSFVAQARADVPDALTLLWFGSHAPSATAYVPLYLGAEGIPQAFTKGSLHKYDPKVAFWQFLAVGNYAARFYRYAMEDVRKAQNNLMERSMAAVIKTEQLVIALLKKAGESDSAINDDLQQAIRTALTSTVYDHASLVMSTWQDLFHQVITKYHDGYVAEDLEQPTIRMRKLFYPKFWLDATGYWESKSNTGPGVILFSPNEEMLTISESNGRVLTAVVFTSIFVGVFSVLGVMIFQKKQSLYATSSRDYLPVDNL